MVLTKNVDLDSDPDDPDVFLSRLGSATDSEGEDTFIPTQEKPRIGTSVDLSFDGMPAGRTIRIAEDSSGGCGGKTWEAASVMCNYLVFRQANATPEAPFLNGRRTIELGAGTGVVGILAAMEAARASGADDASTEVIITDMLFLDLMRKNVELNLTEREREIVRVEQLTWGKPLSQSIKPPYDIIIASDCVYLEAAFDPLIQTLQELSDDRTEIIIASKKRRKADKKFFVKLRKYFNVKEVKDDPHYESYIRGSLSILCARKKSMLQGQEVNYK
ncbi:hypothetical protein HK104_009190 [Borealophlyctis nickersoniae]|nr:hypothetical protein HK104_009190 [Borealophlyctis nickersoniae]